MQRETFWMSPFGWADGFRPANRCRIRVPAGSSDQIEFNLGKGTAKRGYRFDTRDPIWICEDEGRCPASKSSHDQISVVSCTDDCLVVSDKNSGAPVNLRYQLNVIDNRGQPVPIDPIIENGGGTIGSR